MKRIISLLILTVTCLSVLSGCGRNCDPVRFDFSYSVEKTKYVRGETVVITSTITNVSGRAHRYVGCSGNDFIPFISLYNDADGEKYYLECDPIVLPSDVVNKKVKNGESGSIVYSFAIPEDAELGRYSLALSYGGDKKEFENVISIIELTGQNEREKYSYSSAIVGSGDNAIKPIQTLAYTTEFTKDGEPWLHGDGMGYYGVFSDPETKVSDFPTIVADGKIEVSSSSASKLGNPRVFSIDYKDYKYSYPGWNGLHFLPSGEYLVMFYENTDTRNTNPNAETYWETVYENIFRLIVPERKLSEDTYSLTFNQTYSLDRAYDLNTKYRAGERVELRLELVYEQYYDVTVDGKEAVMIGSDDTYVIYAFIMPEGNAFVEIKEVSVEIPTR